MRTACTTGAFSLLLVPDEAADNRRDNHEENEADKNGTDIFCNPCEHMTDPFHIQLKS